MEGQVEIVCIGKENWTDNNAVSPPSDEIAVHQLPSPLVRLHSMPVSVVEGDPEQLHLPSHMDSAKHRTTLQYSHTASKTGTAGKLTSGCNGHDGNFFSSMILGTHQNP